MRNCFGEACGDEQESEAGMEEQLPGQAGLERQVEIEVSMEEQNEGKT